MVVFRSRIPGFQTFTPRGTKIRFIGGQLETAKQEVITFLRRGIKKGQFRYHGQVDFVAEIVPAKRTEPEQEVEVDGSEVDMNKRVTEMASHKPPYSKKKKPTKSSV